MNPNQTQNPMQSAPAPVPAPAPVVTPSPVVPPVYTAPKSPSPQHNGMSPRAVYWLIAIILVLGTVYVLLNRNHVPTTKQTFTTENVQVSNNGAGKIPAGFPTDTPVEVANVINSSTMNYPDKHTVLYSITYVTTKQAEEVFSDYGKYLSNTDYIIESTVKTPILISYSAHSTKTGGRLYVVITPQSGGTTVQLSYAVATS